jgi:hypothetical protein
VSARRTLLLDLPHFKDGPLFPQLLSCLYVQASDDEMFFLLFGSERTGRTSCLTTRVTVDWRSRQQQLYSSSSSNDDDATSSYCHPLLLQLDSYLSPPQATERGDLRATERDDLRATETGDLRATERGDLRATERGDLRATERGEMRATERGDLRATESSVLVDDSLLSGSLQLRRVGREGSTSMVFQLVDIDKTPPSSSSSSGGLVVDLIDLSDAVRGEPSSLSRLVPLSLLRVRVRVGTGTGRPNGGRDPSEERPFRGDPTVDPLEVVYLLYETTHSGGGRRLHLGCWSVDDVDDHPLQRRHRRHSHSEPRPFPHDDDDDDGISHLSPSASPPIAIPEEIEIEVRPDRHFGLGLRLEVEHRPVIVATAVESSKHHHQTHQLCTVVSSFKPHPITHLPMMAEASGRIRAGDELVAVGGVPLRGKSLSDVIHSIRSVLAAVPSLTDDDDDDNAAAALVMLTIRKRCEQEKLADALQQRDGRHHHHHEHQHDHEHHEWCPVLRPYRVWRPVGGHSLLPLALPSNTLSADFASSIGRFLDSGSGSSGSVAVAAVEEVQPGVAQVVLRSYNLLPVRPPSSSSSSDSMPPLPIDPAREGILLCRGPLMETCSIPLSSLVVVQCWPKQAAPSRIIHGMVTVLIPPLHHHRLHHHHGGEKMKGLPSLIALYIEVRIEKEKSIDHIYLSIYLTANILYATHLSVTILDCCLLYLPIRSPAVTTTTIRATTTTIIRATATTITTAGCD